MYTVYKLNKLTANPSDLDIVDKFETDDYGIARTHMTSIMRLDPDYEPRCIRFLLYSDKAIGVDYGSWGRFILLTSDGEPLNFENV